MLASGLEVLDEPKELVAFAAMYGGGMALGDHCGFYTAGLMIIGLASAGVPDGRAAAVKARKEFTDEWKKRWPLRCREIKEAQGAKKIAGNCGTLGADAGAILGPLIAPLAANPGRARFALKPKA